MEKLVDPVEIERRAMRGGIAPLECDGLGTMLFVALRALHEEYRKGNISQGQAHAEKILMLKAYKDWRFWEGVFAEDAKRQNELNKLKPKIRTDGCPLCQKIIAIIDGREKYES